MQNHIEFKDTTAEFKMIFVEGGIFEMGGESGFDDSMPIHKVLLNNYLLGEFPVTQAVWTYVMKDTFQWGYSRFKDAKRPVEQVSWEDINGYFLPKLNEMTKDSRPIRTKYCLPTEAEWEYAAQGGKYGQKYSFAFIGSNKLDEVGWYDDNSHGETKVVGLKMSNMLGLFDMSGNVWEWCHDWYRNDYYKNTIMRLVDNPRGSTKGSNRVNRGGSWGGKAQYCSTTYRNINIPIYRYERMGFRLALSFSSL